MTWRCGPAASGALLLSGTQRSLHKESLPRAQDGWRHRSRGGRGVDPCPQARGQQERPPERAAGSRQETEARGGAEAGPPQPGSSVVAPASPPAGDKPSAGVAQRALQPRGEQGGGPRAGLLCRRPLTVAHPHGHSCPRARRPKAEERALGCACAPGAHHFSWPPRILPLHLEWEAQARPPFLEGRGTGWGGRGPVGSGPSGPLCRCAFAHRGSHAHGPGRTQAQKPCCTCSDLVTKTGSKANAWTPCCRGGS